MLGEWVCWRLRAQQWLAPYQREAVATFFAAATMGLSRVAAAAGAVAMMPRRVAAGGEIRQDLGAQALWFAPWRRHRRHRSGCRAGRPAAQTCATSAASARMASTEGVVPFARGRIAAGARFRQGAAAGAVAGGSWSFGGGVHQGALSFGVDARVMCRGVWRRKCEGGDRITMPWRDRPSGAC